MGRVGKGYLYPDGVWRGHGWGLSSPPQDGYFFHMPPSDELQASPRKAWAHYMPFYSISIDNQDGSSDYYNNVFMPPGGAAYESTGGYLRDRPPKRAPSASKSAEGNATFPDFVTGGPYWQVEDAETDAEWAYQQGLDGFFLLTQAPPSGGDKRQAWGPHYVLQGLVNHGKNMQAVLMPDMSTGTGDLSEAELAQVIADQAAYPSAYHLPDGRLLVCPYKAEDWAVSKWNTFMSIMQNTHGITVAFMPSFTEHIDNHRAAFAAADNIWGMTTWGNSHASGNPTDQSSSTANPYGQGKSVIDLGLEWCQSVNIQDSRPSEQLKKAFFESEGSKNLVNSTTIATQLTDYDPGKVHHIQWRTWNDYGESSICSPSDGNSQDNVKELAAYMNVWFKMRAQPTILKDALFLFHRPMPFGTNVQSSAQTGFMSLLAGTANWEFADVLVFATAPGDVTINSGGNTNTVAVPAGMSSVTVALATGTQSASLERDSSTVVSVTSDVSVSDYPLVQDYHWVIRKGVAA